MLPLRGLLPFGTSMNPFLDPSIRAVYFDAVGTVIHPAKPVAHTYALAARRHGADVDAALLQPRLFAAYVRQEVADAGTGWRTSELREADRWRDIVADVLPELPDSTACLAELLAEFARPEAWVVAEGAAEVFDRLAARGLILGMASNFDARLADIVAALPELKRVSEKCLISSVLGWRKPAPEFFAGVVASAGVSAEKILFVGDDIRNDIEGATAAGMRAVRIDRDGAGAISGGIRQLSELLG